MNWSIALEPLLSWPLLAAVLVPCFADGARRALVPPARRDLPLCRARRACRRAVQPGDARRRARAAEERRRAGRRPQPEPGDRRPRRRNDESRRRTAGTAGAFQAVRRARRRGRQVRRRRRTRRDAPVRCAGERFPRCAALARRRLHHGDRRPGARRAGQRLRPFRTVACADHRRRRRARTAASASKRRRASASSASRWN